MRSQIPALLVALALALAVSGCGGGSSPSVRTPGSETLSPSGTTVQLGADPAGNPEFIPPRLESPPGRVTIVFTNDSSVPHDVAIVGNGVFARSKTVAKGEKAKVTVTLDRGIYELYSAVRGQQDAGMQGVLAVS